MGETRILKKINEKIENDSEVTKVDFQKLWRRYSSRFAKAWEALEDERVKKYVFYPSGKTLWIVVGKEREYIVLPEVGFCSCDDFYYNVMNQSSGSCYHLIACHLAKITRKYDLIREEDGLYDALLNDWKRYT